ncbi:hypothetical protein [Sphingomonas yantingensis]|uniref:Uncharacterized protein n=1 Tax=Sphingomonas yantingensis TaxID=1241761 RepID=A0A7W9ATG6_9SPHN|nr:hypothetical protein [Sphingomonas yantingensis]MBB5700131.1 hypothetical protein [Sphingomonas yantingensis]
MSAVAHPAPERLTGTNHADGGGTNAFTQGRRIVSTAFVRLGPGGQLLVTLRDRGEVAMRGAVMEEKQVCGTGPGAAGARRCLPYADVVAARPVDAPVGLQPVPADGVAARERAPARPRGGR